MIAAGCAPRPDADNSAEVARVFGECAFKINTAALGLNVLPDDDVRVTVIQDIVDNLIASRYSNFPWKIKTTVLENASPNAFTTGGGFLGAFSGVYAMADTEAALAGVIAHEIAHMDKLDNLELAGYLEEMLAQQFLQDGIEDYDTGVAVNTVVDFCLAIPGLVSFNWKNDINTEINEDSHPEFNDTSLPYIPFTFSEDPESPYSPEARDPDGSTTISTCNNKLRDAYNEFLVINPEFYTAEFPNRDSLPPIPDDITTGPGGLPGVQSLWAINPWVAFQHSAFSRYAECQTDEAGMLNLFSSGYNPLALNSAFQAILDLFEIDESEDDFRFHTHPSLGQRIEDNTNFINLNSEVLPSIEDIASQPQQYRDYIVMENRISEFEGLRDNAREAIFGVTTASTINTSPRPLDSKTGQFDPISAADIAVLLNKSLRNKQQQVISQHAESGNRCDIFKSVYLQLTGKPAPGCSH
ncbi:MAG: M48 family metalloprotease [Pseudomonadales bacterium]|nr:M48 family metalloprotease [Pseudomonadales bacterium]